MLANLAKTMMPPLKYVVDSADRVSGVSGRQTWYTVPYGLDAVATLQAAYNQYITTVGAGFAGLFNSQDQKYVFTKQKLMYEFTNRTGYDVVCHVYYLKTRGLLTQANPGVGSLFDTGMTIAGNMIKEDLNATPFMSRPLTQLYSIYKTKRFIIKPGSFRIVTLTRNSDSIRQASDFLGSEALPASPFMLKGGKRLLMSFRGMTTNSTDFATVSTSGIALDVRAHIECHVTTMPGAQGAMFQAARLSNSMAFTNNYTAEGVSTASAI